MAFRKENAPRKFVLPDPLGPMSTVKGPGFSSSIEAMLLKPLTVM